MTKALLEKEYRSCDSHYILPDSHKMGDDIEVIDPNGSSILFKTAKVRNSGWCVTAYSFNIDDFKNFSLEVRWIYSSNHTP